MYFSGESIFFISLLLGLMFGWLIGTMVRRKGFGLIGDMAAGIIVAFIGCWLTLASRHAVPPENTNASLPPGYELVVFPLAPLRPLLKPIVYRSREEVCNAIAEAARSNDLPPHFFIRLLYRESSFKPYVISSAGALGIAQFMPETATDRGLDNPFDPVQAIPASARLLRDLSRSSAILASPPLPTMRDRSASRIGSLIRASFRKRRKTTSRSSPAGLRRRGPPHKPVARR